jgi:hypothetical protein
LDVIGTIISLADIGINTWYVIMQSYYGQC